MTGVPLQLRIDEPLSGEKNMAIDAALLDAALDGQATLRFYRWKEPTISLGHFQKSIDQAVPERFASLPAVRRLSGGGAILHDQELTYSCAIPRTHRWSAEPSRLYDVVHDAIVDVFSQFGVTAQLRGDAAFADSSFLCFSRGDARDIVMGNHKVVGSAQRRRRGAILQHGSILLRQSAWAPEFPGAENLSGIPLSIAPLIEELSKRLVPELQSGLRNDSNHHEYQRNTLTRQPQSLSSSPKGSVE